MNAVASELDAALARLERLHPKSIDLKLERVVSVLAALGDPHLAMPPVIHVAGTNGKGSTIAFLKAFAEAAGLRPHVYTSPHLMRFNERIVVAGRQIEDAALLALLERVETANAGRPLTFFEATTAAAFLAFAETPANVALIEVGLGGRFDATNVFDAPACAVVTPVGLDHESFLGDEISKIAFEKAGVLKRGVPGIIGAQTPEARAAIVTEGLQRGALLSVWGKDFRAHREGERLVFEDGRRLLDLPPPALIGSHQVGNAGVAIAAALAAMPEVSDDAIAEGLRKARWPGRLHKLEDGPLARRAADAGGAVYADGAHNPLGAAALATALADLDEIDSRPVALIIGMQRNKDLTGFLAAFQGLARAVIGAPLPGKTETWSPEEIRDAAAALGFEAAAAASLEEALAGALAASEEGAVAPRVVVTGSLYLVGAALSLAAGRTTS